ncbi:MAG: glycosyltransferase, partial [Thermodesulfobacteriota bacterium]
ELIRSLNNKKVICYRLSRRSGSHTALRAGMFYSKSDVVLCLAADGQDNTDCLGAMMGKWRGGKKIVWALRNDRKNEGWFIHLPAKLFYRILLLLIGAKNINVDFSRADFFLLDRSVVDAINKCRERNTSLLGLIAWLGFSQDTVKYDRQMRLAGVSKWTFRSRMRLAKDWILAFSGIPLKLASFFGFFFAITGFLYAIYVFLNAIVGRIPPTGWSSLIIIILFLGGIQMIMLGIIGDYLWQNLDESRQRALFFIESTTEEKEHNLN